MRLLAATLWFFPIYWALVTSFRTDDESIKSYSFWPEHPTLDGYLYIIQRSKLPIFYLNSTIVSVSVTILVPGDVGLRRLCDLATAVSRPNVVVVDNLGKFHDSGAGAYRQSFHHHRLRAFDQYACGHRVAAADRAGDRDRLQTILRFPAARISRGRGNGRRQRISVAVPGVPADELGHYRRARHHHVHRRLE